MLRNLKNNNIFSACFIIQIMPLNKVIFYNNAKIVFNNHSYLNLYSQEFADIFSLFSIYWHTCCLYNSEGILE